jgi:hypothetical protein
MSRPFDCAVTRLSGSTGMVQMMFAFRRDALMQPEPPCE